MSEKHFNQNSGDDKYGLAAALLMAEADKGEKVIREGVYDRITNILSPVKQYAERLEDENEDFILSTLLEHAYLKIKQLLDALEDQTGEFSVIFRKRPYLYKDFNTEDIVCFELDSKEEAGEEGSNDP